MCGSKLCLGMQVGGTLRPGVPFAFCIAAIVATLLTATNLATGEACFMTMYPHTAWGQKF